MPNNVIVDEVDSSLTAKVFNNKALKVAPMYNFTYLPTSAEATGIIAAGPCFLHSVVFQDSATATTYLVLANSASVAGSVGSSASAVACFGTITKNTFIFDAILSAGLTYRVTGSAIGPTTITYSLAS